MRWKAVIVAACLLGACGGGGGGGGDPPPPPPPPVANRAPAITSAATASFAENGTGIAYQAAATDPDGDAVTFRIEGPDAARFVISASGGISFVTPPNFEAPADADGNNAYQITLIASDGKAESRLDLTISVSNLPDELGGRYFSFPGVASALIPVPGSTDVFVATRTGQIYRWNPAQPAPGTLYLTIGNVGYAGFGEGGVINIAVPADYQTSGHLYAYVRSSDQSIHVRRYDRSSAGLGDPASERLIVRVPYLESFSSSENLGGGLAFGPDNLLYIGTGILGIGDSRAQNLSLLHGKILRLDVSRDDFPGDAARNYGIPAGNPFSSGAREIFAFGLEDPRRMSFDGTNLLIGDHHRLQGIKTPPEVHLLRPQDAGANFGHLDNQGPNPIPPVITLRPGNIVSDGSMTGGLVYRGRIQSLVGLYIFADPLNRRTWVVPAVNIVQGRTIQQEGVGEIPLPPDRPDRVVSFGTDALGNLYFVDGRVYLVEER